MRERRWQSISLWIMGCFLTVLLWMPQVGSAADGTADLVIFHTNDMHARIVTEDDNGSSIGLAEMAAVVKMEKAKNPDTLWLDAGDTIHGMPRINVSRGESAVPLLNQAGINAMSPGNHDFNYGSDQLEKLAKKMKFPVLSANIARKGTGGKLIFPPYKIYRLPNNIKVGVFGLSTPECAYKTSPSNVATVEFLNPVTAAKSMVQELDGKCDVIVAVMHMGVDESSEFTSERIAREVPGIDLIVDGHSHTTLPEGMAVGDTLIVQTGWHECKLGQVNIRLQEHRIVDKRAKLLDEETVMRIAPKPDVGIARGIERLDKQNAKLFGEVVAHSDKALTSERLILRRQESEIGNLCADAFRWRSGADFAIINGGGMRSDLPAGDVTRGDIMAIFPFGNTLKMAEIKGSAVREMLEHSVYGYPASFGGFLNVSGLTFSFDPTQPVGSRVKDISIQGQPLDENRTYKMAATDFAFAGGDDYDMLKGLVVVGEFDTCEQVVADYLNAVGMSGIETGRITMLKDVAMPVQAPKGDNAEGLKEAA